ncbi:MAG: hypothetical protein AB7U79_02230 [Candidatus Izemoplasmatales bacterium]
MITNHSVYSKEDYLTIIQPKYLKMIYRKKLFNLLFVMFYYIVLFLMSYKQDIDFPPLIDYFLYLVPWSIVIPLPKKVYMKKWMEPTKNVNEIIHHVEFHPYFVKFDVNSPKEYADKILPYEQLIGYFYDEDRLYLVHKSIIFMESSSFDDKSLKNAVKLLNEKKVKKIRYLF